MKSNHYLLILIAFIVLVAGYCINSSSTNVKKNIEDKDVVYKNELKKQLEDTQKKLKLSRNDLEKLLDGHWITAFVEDNGNVNLLSRDEKRYVFNILEITLDTNNEGIRAICGGSKCITVISNSDKEEKIYSLIIYNGSSKSVQDMIKNYRELVRTKIDIQNELNRL